jgi:BarA-like signal transduction histidine kinase
MAATLNQIQQDLGTLLVAVQKIAREVEQAYQHYLETLAQSVRQQMILASYHVCTQVYPEHFLRLSKPERERLQVEIQRLGLMVQTKLYHCWAEPLASDELLPAPDPAAETDWTTPSLPPTLPPTPIQAIANLTQTQANTEAMMVEILHEASRQLDECLQELKILPVTPLEMIFDIATKAEAAGKAVTRTPNLLTAVVNPEEDDEEPDTGTVIAIYLQLGEIEFNDPVLMGERNQLRKLTTQATKLERQIRKKQREQQMVMAADSWRATWHTVEDVHVLDQIEALVNPDATFTEPSLTEIAALDIPWARTAMPDPAIPDPTLPDPEPDTGEYHS